MKQAFLLALGIALIATILGTVPAMRMYEAFGNALNLPRTAPLLPLPLPYLLLQNACLFVLLCVLFLAKLPTPIQQSPYVHGTVASPPSADVLSSNDDVTPHTSLI